MLLQLFRHQIEATERKSQISKVPTRPQRAAQKLYSVYFKVLHKLGLIHARAIQRPRKVDALIAQLEYHYCTKGNVTRRI